MDGWRFDSRTGVASRAWPRARDDMASPTTPSPMPGLMSAILSSSTTGAVQRRESPPTQRQID
eukprot:13859049-Heterocapsa_arctica.AAC.1